MARLTKTKVKNALEKAGGMPVAAARLLEVSYVSLWRFLRSNPELKEYREIARSKLHEDLETLTSFAVKTGYIQTAVLDENGKITKKIIYEPIDFRTRLQQASFLMNQYRATVGLKTELDITTNGEKINNNAITVIELPEELRPEKDETKE